MKPLKVLILITKSNWGGAQRYVFDVATKLPKEQFAVEIMTGSEGPLLDKLHAAGIAANGNLEIGRDVSFFRDVRAAFRLASLLRKDRPDVLHLNSSKIGGVGAFAGRMAGVGNIIFTVHGWAFNENRPIAQKGAIAFLYWITMVLSHRVMVVSEAARRQIKNWPWIQDKITVVHNGIDKETGFSRTNARLELVRLNPALKKAVDGVPESQLVWIGTIAELHHVKGHEYALRAVASCLESLKSSDPKKQVVYTIMGDGEERERLETLIRNLHLEGKVFLMGHVTGAAQYVKAFDICLLASLSEALSYTLLEAGASSVAVVASAVGGIPEVVSDGVSGVLVQPKNHRDLTHALLFMIEHPEERHKYGTALKEKVSRDFSLEKMMDGVKRVYLGK
ncbi:MAG: glycosyltransferase [Candidatus Paceibacterota bacterium]